jgi:hypothetical protein
MGIGPDAALGKPQVPIGGMNTIVAALLRLLPGSAPD